ncbi:MAG TPA: PfkB family carbohydrate kinase [Armatimonadota bacterium]|jgi:sugar/nucleoside kinase (ribokinase family)
MNQTEATRFDVVALGGAAWDLLGIYREYPQPGEKTELLNVEEQGGGQAATAAVAVARLGGRAAILGTTGSDDYARKIVESFASEGVDTRGLLRIEGTRSHIAFCMIQEESGDRAIFFDRGNKRKLEPEDLDREMITGAGCLLFDTHHWKAAVTAATWAREAGVPVLTDLERPTANSEDLLRLGTHHVMPEHYLLECTGESDPEAAARLMRERYAPEVLVVTRGARGAVAYAGCERLEQPAFPVDPVIDTTGAGDVFHGAFGYGLVLGYDLATNLEFAALVAALKCRQLGGRAGIPTREELAGLWRLPLP